jgi:hypothetical protein
MIREVMPAIGRLEPNPARFGNSSAADIPDVPPGEVIDILGAGVLRGHS